MGDRYLDYLIDLWLTVAEDRPDGVLEGWDEIDIALASGCEGNAAAYADALIECGFLDVDHLTYKIHDWSEHQGWASKAKIRSEAAKKAAEYRWERRYNYLKKCGRKAPAKRVHQIRNAPSPNPTPSPNPSPNPNPPIKRDISFDRFWSCYPKKVGKAAAQKAWGRLNGKRPDIEVVITKLEELKASDQWTEQNGRFIPNPATWLNRGGWDDEVCVETTTIQNKGFSMEELHAAAEEARRPIIPDVYKLRKLTNDPV